MANPPLETVWKVLLGGVLWISVGSNEDPQINKLRKPIKKKMFENYNFLVQLKTKLTKMQLKELQIYSELAHLDSESEIGTIGN